MLSWLTSGRLYDEAGNALEVKRVKADIALGATDAELIAAVAGKKLRILWIVVSVLANTLVTIHSKPAGAGVPITCDLQIPANYPLVVPFNPFGWLETASGEGLSTTVEDSSNVGFLVGFVEVP